MKDKEEGLSLIEKVREIDKREKRREIFLDIIWVVSRILSIIVTCLIWNCFIN